MRARPTSVTVISWILIVVAALNLVSTLATLNNPMVAELMAKSPLPIPVQYGMIFAGLTVSLVSGVAMLQGQNWARWLYIVWGGIGLVVSLVTSPLKLMLIPGIVIFLLIAFFLLSPKANRYFLGADDQYGQEDN